MPNDCASFDQAGNPESPASMPGCALGDKDGSSRRDKDWAARPPGNIKSKPTNPAILTTYEGMHHDAVSSITAMIVVSCSRAVRDLLASKTCDMRRSIGVSVDGVESATTLTVRPIGSHAARWCAAFQFQASTSCS